MNMSVPNSHEKLNSEKVNDGGNVEGFVILLFWRDSIVNSIICKTIHLFF